MGVLLSITGGYLLQQITDKICLHGLSTVDDNGLPIDFSIIKIYLKIHGKKLHQELS